jgi:hypothetical protein
LDRVALPRSLWERGLRPLERRDARSAKRSDSERFSAMRSNRERSDQSNSARNARSYALPTYATALISTNIPLSSAPNAVRVGYGCGMSSLYAALNRPQSSMSAR